MNEQEMLSAKAREIQDGLRDWVLTNFASGKQILVSLKIEDIPEDLLSEMKPFLQMPVTDFFTLTRLRSHQSKESSSCAGKARWRINSLAKWHEKDNKEILSVERLIELYDASEIERHPRIGVLTVQVIQNSLKSVGLSLRDPMEILQ
jgi:hypothetical protein